MKTRLPKMLLAALMAAATVAPVQAKGVYNPGQIIGVDSNGNSVTATVTPEEISAGNTLTVHAPNAKDGDGVITVSVTANSNISNALCVREGTLLVQGESTGGTLNRLTITPYFAGVRYDGAPTTVNVSGKDAVMVVDNVRIYNGVYSAMSVGGADGSGTLIIQNGAHLDNSNGSTIFIGYPGYLDKTKDEEIGWGNGHATTNGVNDDASDLSNRYVGTYYAAANDPNQQFGKGVVTVKGQSSLTSAYQLTMAEGELNVEDKSIVTISPGNWGTCYLGYRDGSTSVVNIKSGSKIDLFGTYLRFGYGDNSNVTVNIDGEGSQLNAPLGEAATGVILGGRDGGAATATINVTNKGELNVKNIAAGDKEGLHDVKINIDSQSSYTGKNLTMNSGAELNNAGRSSVDSIYVEGGLIANSGNIVSQALLQTGGTVDNFGTMAVEQLTLTAGVLNNAGVLNVKSQLEVAKAATLNCLAGSTISGVMPTGCTYSFTLSSKNLSEAGTTLAAGTQYSTATPLTLTLTAAENLKAGKYMLLDATAGVQTNRSATPAAVESVSGLGATKEDIVWEDGILYFNLGENLIVARDPLADAVQASNWGVFKSSQAFVGTLFAPRTNAVVVESDGKGGIVPAEAMTLAWGTAYSSFSRQGGSGEFGGAEYSIYGAAVGVERQFASGRSVGVALGYDWGRVSPYNTARVDQDSWHVALYGRAAQWKVGQKGELAIDWSAAAGNTTSECDALGADWSQDSMQLDVRATYTRELTERTACSVFAGVQYYAQNDDSTSRVEADSLQNLRLMAGAGISHKLTNRATVYGEVSVYNDAMRHNPGVVLDGFTYGTGANPGRIGGDVTVGAQYGLSEQWTLRGSYSFEAAENNRVHNVNVGAVYSF